MTRLAGFHQRLVRAGLGSSYEAEHARLAVEYLAVCYRRLSLRADGKLEPLPTRSQYAADKSYFDTTAKLSEGLETLLQSYHDSNDPHQAQVYRLWNSKHREP